MQGKIYLIPNLLGDCEPSLVIPEGVIKSIHGIRNFIVENTRTARRFLIRIKHPLRPDEIVFFELNKHKPEQGIAEYINICLAGNDLGIISEAGMPGIADPGSILVKEGHKKGLQVIPLTGPSSVFLALSASGMNGQNFLFHGYLPIRAHERSKKIKEIELESAKHTQTQIFIETPYRNMLLLDELLKHCLPSTLLCIACELTTENEYVRTERISTWQKHKPELNKKPCVFLLLKE